ISLFGAVPTVCQRISPVCPAISKTELIFLLKGEAAPSYAMVPETGVAVEASGGVAPKVIKPFADILMFVTGLPLYMNVKDGTTAKTPVSKLVAAVLPVAVASTVPPVSSVYVLVVCENVYVLTCALSPFPRIAHKSKKAQVCKASSRLGTLTFIV